MTARRVVLFDLDGTLVDTIPDIAAALGRALEGTGVAPPPLEVVKRMVGDGSLELVRRALATAPADRAREEAVRDRFVAAYQQNVCVDSSLYPGVADGLAALRGDGMALAVVTNKVGDLARTLLATLGIATSFEAIVGDGDGLPRKPDPAAARAVLVQVGGAAQRTAVVGDGLPDMRLARALGATAVAATWGYVPAAALAGEGPRFLAGSFGEAIAMIRNVAAG